jgi:integral membrane protein
MTRSARSQSVSGAFQRYRALAYATGCFLLLLTVHVLVQWHQSSSEDIPFSQAQGLGKWLPGGDYWIPAGHGWLYLLYVIASVDLWLRTRLPFGRMLLVVLAGTVPAMSFVAEHWVAGRVRPMIGAVVERPAQDVPAER